MATETENGWMSDDGALALRVNYPNTLHSSLDILFPDHDDTWFTIAMKRSDIDELIMMLQAARKQVLP